jgi:hypothetical protein
MKRRCNGSALPPRVWLKLKDSPHMLRQSAPVSGMSDEG